ncbi:hypothetical protein Ssi03_24470 [Sphaerisporangium siamense]|nr:hypothetical protein Ssi03_24470 [Sphaerisporangium siamense]
MPPSRIHPRNNGSHGRGPCAGWVPGSLPHGDAAGIRRRGHRGGDDRHRRWTLVQRGFLLNQNCGFC